MALPRHPQKLTHVLAAPGLALLLAGWLASQPLLAQSSGAASLRLFAGGFSPGLYAVSVPGAPGDGVNHCLADPSALVFGLSPPPASCRVTVLQDAVDRAALSWSCPGGESGRTEIRRHHAELFVVQGQGVRDGRPWSATRQFQRIGPCPPQGALSRR
ncbi:hypothetical protein [Thermaurantiacus sp.]